jgi:guanine deaminase
MPLARFREAGLKIGLGSDVAGGPDPSIFEVMQVGAYAQASLRTMSGEHRPILQPLDWLRVGTLDGAAALGLDGVIGSIEVGKEADLIAVDPRVTAPRRDLPYDPERVAPEEVMSRLIFRAHQDMVRGAWVRGRRLEGPADPA